MNNNISFGGYNRLRNQPFDYRGWYDKNGFVHPWVWMDNAHNISASRITRGLRNYIGRKNMTQIIRPVREIQEGTNNYITYNPDLYPVSRKRKIGAMKLRVYPYNINPRDYYANKAAKTIKRYWKRHKFTSDYWRNSLGQYKHWHENKTYK